MDDFFTLAVNESDVFDENFCREPYFGPHLPDHRGNEMSPLLPTLRASIKRSAT